MSIKKKYYIILICLVISGALLVFAALFANNLLTAKAKELTDLKVDSKVIDEQQSAVKQANKDIEKYSELDAIAKSIVPQDKGQAQTVREIVQIAEQSGIKLSAINFPVSTLGQPTPKTNTQDSSTKTTTPPITQVKPVENVSGVYSMEITIQQDSNNPIPYARFIEFLQRLEKNRRTAQVVSITVQPNSKDRSKLTFSLIVNVYIKP